jgi:hypothetical protein
MEHKILICLLFNFSEKVQLAHFPLILWGERREKGNSTGQSFRQTLSTVLLSFSRKNLMKTRNLVICVLAVSREKRASFSVYKFFSSSEFCKLREKFNVGSFLKSDLVGRI